MIGFSVQSTWCSWGSRSSRGGVPTSSCTYNFRRTSGLSMVEKVAEVLLFNVFRMGRTSMRARLRETTEGFRPELETNLTTLWAHALRSRRTSRPEALSEHSPPDQKMQASNFVARTFARIRFVLTDSRQCCDSRTGSGAFSMRDQTERGHSPDQGAISMSSSPKPPVR